MLVRPKLPKRITVSAYLIAQVKVNDDNWIPEFAAKVHDFVHRHGGKYLTRSTNVTTIEGDASGSDLIAIIEFPDVDAIRAFAKDPGYARFAAARQAGTVSCLESVDAVDAAGTIPYLEKAG